MTTLKEWRDKKAVSLRELSERSGVETSTLVYIEAGRRKPRHITKKKIARALGLLPEEIEFLVPRRDK